MGTASRNRPLMLCFASWEATAITIAIEAEWIDQSQLMRSPAISIVLAKIIFHPILFSAL